MAARAFASVPFLLSLSLPALLLTGLLGCSKSRAPSGGMPLHPETRAASIVALLHSDGMRYLPEDRESHPVRIAMWRDGTLIWSDAAGADGGHPYRIAQLDARRVESCLARLRTALERLPHRDMWCTVCDGDSDDFRFADGSASYDLASWPGAHVGDDPSLVPVLDECSAILLAERTAKNQVLTDVHEFAFDGKQ